MGLCEKLIIYCLQIFCYSAAKAVLQSSKIFVDCRMLIEIKLRRSAIF